MSKRFIALLAAVLAIAAIAGCGSGDSTEGTAGGAAETTSASEDNAGGPPLSKAEFIKQGDEICKESTEEAEGKIAGFLQDLDLGEGGEPSEDDQARLVEEIVAPSIRNSAEGIAALSPPKGEEDAVAEIVDGLEEALAGVEEDPAAAVAGDPFGDVNEKAVAFGFKVCGEN